MSGGSFNYKCFEISLFADELKCKIEMNDVPDLDNYDFCWDFSEETIQELKTCHMIIELAGKLAKDVEWLYSSDHGEESFNRLCRKTLSEADWLRMCPLISCHKD